jgi:hypothetical protein
MRIVKKNVYYCDFCKKKNLSGHAMKVHEKHCTANPDRECRLCDAGNIKDLIEEIKTSFTIVQKPCIQTEIDRMFYREDETFPGIEWKGTPFTMDKLREITEDCPVCLLAVLRQTELYKLDSQEYEFDFKAESKEYHNEKWREINSHRSDHY